jgi:phosphatidylinositol alpha-mannosyltransferase
MKIGFVLDESFDGTDGVQQYMITLGNWLKSKKHEVYYLVGKTERRDIENIYSFSRNV